MSPTLTVVTGPGGSGKTTLAHALASAIPCPAVCRDEIKEGMVHPVPGFKAAPDDELTRRTFTLFFEVIRLLLEGSVSVVAEAAFQDRLWRPQLESLESQAKLRVIHCHVEPAVCRARRVARGNRPAHADAHEISAGDDRTASTFEHLAIGAPTIVVDTTNGYSPSLDKIVAFVNAG